MILAVARLKSAIRKVRLLTVFANSAYFLVDFRVIGTAVWEGQIVRLILARKVAAPSSHPKLRRQRSFNWQSIAFVMRGLWVQIPPLAFSIW